MNVELRREINGARDARPLELEMRDRLKIDTKLLRNRVPGSNNQSSRERN